MIKIVLFFFSDSSNSTLHLNVTLHHIRPKLGLTVTSLTYTYTSVLREKMPLSNASGAIHFIGSFFTLVTSYIPLSFAWRNKPKSEIFTALSSPSRILRAARSRWMNPLLAKYSWQRNNEIISQRIFSYQIPLDQKNISNMKLKWKLDFTIWQGDSSLIGISL